MNKKYIISAILFLLNMPLIGHAQENYHPQANYIRPHTPDVGTLTKLINFPVSHHTGTVNVSIPLYEIKAGDMTLPLSLNYHTGGYRPNEPKSWVGQGWSLTAEPLLGRSIGGMDDFKSGGYYTEGCTNATLNIHDLIRQADGLREMEPDDFFYRLSDRSGNFQFSKNGPDAPLAVVTRPYAPLQIDCQVNSVYNQYFDITDEKGISYRFGRSRRSGDYLNESNEANGEKSISAWKITEMISAATNDTICFDYHPATRKKLPYRKDDDMFVVEDSMSYIDIIPDFCHYNPDVFSKHAADIKARISGRTYLGKIDELYDNDYRYISYHLEKSDDYVFRLPEDYITERKLSRIGFRGGYVEFLVNAYNDLTDIRIRRTDGTLVRQIRFSYMDFSIRNNTHEYVLLTEVKMLDGNGKTEETYRFNYYHTKDGAPANNLLCYRSTDLWGFYSGFVSFDESMPYSTRARVNNLRLKMECGNRNMTIDGLSGEPDSQERIRNFGCLETITYPTGGVTRFVYEHHKVPNELPARGDKRIGGLRIVELQHYDPATADSTIHRYRYGRNENGLGHAKSDFNWTDYMAEQTCLYRDSRLGVYNHARRRTFYGAPLVCLLTESGTSTLYDTVTEYVYAARKGTQRVPMGKTVWTYRINTGANRNYRFPNTTMTYEPKEEWRGGLLTGKYTYKAKPEGGYALVAHEGYDYEIEDTETIPVGKTFRRNLLFGYDFTNSPTNKERSERIELYRYTIRSGRMVLRADTSIVYVNGTERKNIRRYEYADAKTGNAFVQVPTCIRMTTSDGKSVTDEYDYAFNSGSDAATGLKGERRLATLLEHRHLKEDAAIVSQQRYARQNNRMMLQTIAGGKSGSENITLQVHRYDKYGNPLYFTQNQQLDVVCLWAYGSAYPVAKIEGATYAEVENWLGASAISSLATNTRTVPAALKDIRGKLAGKNVQVTTYTFQPLVGMTSMTAPNGEVTSYTYDPFGRLTKTTDHSGKTTETHEYNYKP